MLHGDEEKGFSRKVSFTRGTSAQTWHSGLAQAATSQSGVTLHAGPPRHDTWHRGTPLTPGTRRFAQNITYRLARAEWISTLHIGWAWSAFSPDHCLEKLLARCSLDQRAVLGFPPPESEYWCEETLAAVEARYGAFGMDVTPYRDALAATRRTGRH